METVSASNATGRAVSVAWSGVKVLAFLLVASGVLINALSGITGPGHLFGSLIVSAGILVILGRWLFGGGDE